MRAPVPIRRTSACQIGNAARARLRVVAPVYRQAADAGEALAQTVQQRHATADADALRGRNIVVHVIDVGLAQEGDALDHSHRFEPWLFLAHKRALKFSLPERSSQAGDAVEKQRRLLGPCKRS